jgi:hypothetical protein
MWNAEVREAYVAAVYHQLCRAGDIERAVADLDDDTLRHLIGYLARLGIESGVPGLIAGIAQVSASDRWVHGRNSNLEGVR